MALNTERVQRVTALDAPGVRSRLRRSRIGAVLLFSVGVLVTLTVVVAAPLLDRMYSGRQSRFDRIPGAIVDLQDTGGSDSDAGTVWVEYFVNGDRRLADVHVDDTDGWSDGELVGVLIDPHDHSSVTLPGENYLPGWFGLLWFVLGAGAFAAVIGAIALARLPKVRRALAAGPWRSVVGRRIRVGSGENALHLLFLPEVAGGSFWRLLRRPGKGSEFRVDVAGTDDRELVVRPRGSHRLLLARLAQTAGRVEGRVTAVARRGETVAVRIDDAERAGFYEFKDPDLAAGLDDDALDGMSAVTVWHGPAGAVAALMPGDEIPVVGVGVAARKARRRWPALEPR